MNFKKVNTMINGIKEVLEIERVSYIRKAQMIAKTK
jgi:hypothetical protein|tara:strand:+ start:5841 stop:5948 length:108 start_codon:yes stop_codon:yes gene_type:complete